MIESFLDLFTVVERNRAEARDERRTLKTCARTVNRFKAVLAKRDWCVETEHSITLEKQKKEELEILRFIKFHTHSLSAWHYQTTLLFIF